MHDLDSVIHTCICDRCFCFLKVNDTPVFFFETIQSHVLLFLVKFRLVKILLLVIFADLK